MVKRAEIPVFGVLSGLKVVSATVSTAGPFAGEMFAEMGADVIWIESPLSPDVNRINTGLAAESERRNQRNLSLNIATSEGKEVLFRLLKDADIFMEASKGGQYDKWGLADEVLWRVNPRLVIIHISGFGQTGDPKYVQKGCYDPIAQAFSGLMSLQGYPDRPPMPAHKLPTDYLVALSATTAALGALYKAQKTGMGESIDLAQYEVAFRCQAERSVEYLNLELPAPQEGGHNPRSAGWGVYECKDGKYVYIICLGVPILKIILPMLGLEFGSEDYPPRRSNVLRAEPSGQEFERRLIQLCSEHTALEMEETLWEKGVPCCRIMSYADIVEHPHYKARGTIVEWPAVPGGRYEGKMVRGAAFPLRFKNNPSQIWRGCPTVGMDNEDVLADAGYTDEEIAALYTSKTIFKESKK